MSKTPSQSTSDILNGVIDSKIDSARIRSAEYIHDRKNKVAKENRLFILFLSPFLSLFNYLNVVKKNLYTIKMQEPKPV